ncbi:MAG: SurA N-terminal domain-containing protein [Pseudolabrys sp.]|nr:SurA N-terminal domain-containing protein [Pseudolabrys sp.]
MLRGIKTASTGWVGKTIMTLVMGMLVVSFAIWGIGDIFRGFGRNAVAQIGSTEISIEQFRNYYNDRLTQLGRRLGRPITPDQARALGFERQLLGQFVAETTLDERARDLRLGIADAEISRRITSDPAFQNLTGQFDRQRFEQMIRQAGYNENSYIREQRQLTLRRQIALAVSGEVIVPQVALMAFDRFQNEKRNIDVALIGPSQAGDIPEPTPEALAKYFDERKASFRVPEQRQVTLLILSADEQARWSVISDADARDYYEKNKAEFSTPEKRQVGQIVFPNAEEARAAQERIAKGLSFDDLAKERNLSDADVDLGAVTKSQIIDPAIADAAFALKEGEVSAPVQGRFGNVLLQVKSIEAGSQQAYEQAADAIKRRIADQRARAETNALRDKIEDERAGGSSLAETAKKNNLVARTIPAIDRSGRDAAGAPVGNLPAGVDIVSAAFNASVNAETDPLQLPSGGYVWYEVTGISPSRDRTFDESKDQVAARWRDDEVAARVKKIADDVVAKTKAGTPLAQAAADAKAQVQTVRDLQRNKPGQNVPPATLDAIFRAPKGVAVNAESARPTERAVFVVTDITEPKLDAASGDGKEIADTLRRGYTEDLIGEYVARLETEYGVSINQQALNQVVGGAAN